MSLQIILRKPDAVATLGDLASRSDVFPLSDGTIGVAIPTKVFDAAGEEQIARLLRQIEHFDLWAGQWKKPNQSPEPMSGLAPGHGSA